MKVVENKNKNVADLKKGIRNRYLEYLKSELIVLKYVLADKEWASDGSEFHKQCRIDTKNEIAEIERQIKVLL